MPDKIDTRIKLLIANGVSTQHRSIFVIVGNQGKDQVVTFHHLLSQAKGNARPSVLWCYKKELGFSSHTKKKMKQIQKKIKSGRLNVNEDDPFDLFVASTSIRYCHYSDSHTVLGNTYGMCILQDFEALTPNLLARTIETVEGGGLIVVLLRPMTSLKELFTLTMDVHAKFRTESHQDVIGRFNERFVLSLGTCKSCLVMDDKLQLLPISSHALDIELLPAKSHEESYAVQSEMSKLINSIPETNITAHKIVQLCRTLDQTHGFMKLIEVLQKKTLSSTVVMTAARGRGKSATLGLSLASSVDFGYSNIFVTAPSPENLKTLFEFIFKGFDALGYQENKDYEILTSTNPDFNKAVVRVNIFRNHRQTLQYIHPADSHKLGQAELVCIDEAAAIPLPLVKNLLGPYLVFMSSTINGYEGTGRSLSLKLIHQLRQQSCTTGSQKTKFSGKETDKVTFGRTLVELELKESVRYAPNDPVEAWLNDLLCLDANINPWSISDCPQASSCHLYSVNRDTLFSFHGASEKFLHKVMALYVSSHYKNSPNDLQLLSDAPAHQIFVLLGPTRANQKDLPEVLCVLQVCLEGGLTKSSVAKNLDRGVRASGDLIPWTISQQFLDHNFACLSGARVVRIATHPDYQRMGYGSVALDQLQKFYEGEFSKLKDTKDLGSNLENSSDENVDISSKMDKKKGTNLFSEILEPRTKLPPLLVRLEDSHPEKLHYLGVSFGLTSELFRFWKKSGYVPLYLRQTPNELTGEHSCIMIKEINTVKVERPVCLQSYWKDFQRRFVSLLSYQFRTFKPSHALEILRNKNVKTTETDPLNLSQLTMFFNPSDLQRLKLYSNNMVDYHMIVDVLPVLSRLYFTGLIKLHLTIIQSSILLALGLQHKTVEDIEKDLELPVTQILGQFKESITKFVKLFRELKDQDQGETFSKVQKQTTLDKCNSSSRAEKDLDISLQSMKSTNERKHKLPEDCDTSSQGTTKKKHKQTNV
ncbi:RNA cytidine acetyltransferase-like isoform X3 [Biomphalaria glabrata]|uniref:RNA cytidine acetyltransferase n=1 Tax=Biomphalaria glabrata TaxID=6526 RepID=A0A9U8EII8_BIOGL|nr:RNA cytidine acetyltransferase-like isoform X3 [Biomphalaria glabrata]